MATVRMTASSPIGTAAEPLLRITNLSKTFAGVRALDDVDFTIEPGEIRALVGKNGSGKSTLIKILAGVYTADRGATIGFDGHSLDQGDQSGDDTTIRFVHQDLGLILELTGTENLALRNILPPGPLGRVSLTRIRGVAEQLIKPFGISIDLDVPVGELTPVQRTVLVLAAALRAGEDGSRAKLVVLDEPTASLPASEVSVLLDIVRSLPTHGVSVIYVSHRLDEIFEVATTVTVLRNGREVATREVGSLTQPELVELMVGDVVTHDRGTARVQIGDKTVLKVRNLGAKYLQGVSFDVREGEILGVAGIAGSGSQELPYCIANTRPGEASGELRLPTVSDKWIDLANCSVPLLPIVPADRLRESIVQGLSVGDNLTLSSLNKVSRRGWIRRRAERLSIDWWVDQLSVKTASVDSGIETLSGGNQQKVIVGRCLARGGPVVALCEPTAGVDVSAREAIYEVLIAAAKDGMAFVVSSSDIGDLLAVCSRVLVIQQGRIVQELNSDEISEASIFNAI